jgi:hypothetical protein
MKVLQATTERLGAFSDAVIITVMVLELKAPDGTSLSALLPLWPTAIFAVAMLMAVFAPKIGFALICCALIPYLKPEPTGTSPLYRNHRLQKGVSL